MAMLSEKNRAIITDNMYRQFSAIIRYVSGQTDKQTDRRTNRHTEMLLTTVRIPTGESNKTEVSLR